MLIERQGKNGFVNFDKVVLIDTTVDTEGYANVFVRYENGEIGRAHV